MLTQTIPDRSVRHLGVLCSSAALVYCSVLDEATSALSEKSEDSLYSKLMDLGITFMSIGQRSSLMKVSWHYIHTHFALK